MTEYVTSASTELVQRPQMGGQGVDVLDAEFEVDRHGGFGGASLDVVPPWGLSRFDTDFLQGLEVNDTNQHRLWEGRCEEPDLPYRWAPRINVEANGYGGYLTDDEYFMRCYADNDLANWQTDQATQYADRFSIGIEDDDKLVMRVRVIGNGDMATVIESGMNCRTYWQLFRGITTTQQITALKFAYAANGFDDDLRCRIYGRDKLTGWTINRVIWTSPNAFAPSGTVSLDANDIGSGVRVLVARLEATTNVNYGIGSGEPDDWRLTFGIAFSNVRVYASDLGSNITPERVVRNAVLGIVDDDHIDFPDASGFSLEHCDFSDPTTIAQVVEDMNAMLDWNWGFDDGAVFFYRRPWTAATVPPGELVVTSYADPAMIDWSVRQNFLDAYNRVVAHYMRPNGRPGRVTVSNTEGPLGSTMRTRFIDLTDVCSSAADATTVANAHLASSLWPAPTGTITLRGDAHLAAGIDVPALYLRPGMMIRNLDIAADVVGPPEQRGRMLITHVSGRLAAREVTVQVGIRADRLSRILARRQHAAKRIKRRGKQR